jgi:hypothetical protein
MMLVDALDQVQLMCFILIRNCSFDCFCSLNYYSSSLGSLNQFLNSMCLIFSLFRILQYTILTSYIILEQVSSTVIFQLEKSILKVK